MNSTVELYETLNALNKELLRRLAEELQGNNDKAKVAEYQRQLHRYKQKSIE